MPNQPTAHRAGLLKQKVTPSQSVVRSGTHVPFSLLLLALLLLPQVARCQSRLEQLEATYQSNLRALEVPILQEYLRQLDFLKSQFVARNRVDDAKQVDAEITRVKSIASTTGVLPFTELEGSMATIDANALKPGSAAKNDPSPLPTLLAAEALKGGEINAKNGAFPIGYGEWRLFKLPAGTYDVLLVFASESLPLPEQLTLTIDGHEFPAVIPVDRATGSSETFRLLRLCQVKLDTDVNGGTLNLAASTKGKPVLWLKKLMFAAPKKPDAPTTK